MIGNIKRTFLPKTGMQEKQLLQDPGYVEDIRDSCCMLHTLCRIMSKTSKILKQAITDFEQISLSLFHYCRRCQRCMCTNYNVDPNTKTLNYSKI